MKYTNITPDQTFQIIYSLVHSDEFKESIEELQLSPNEIIETIEELFYELTREDGFSFRGMKKDEINMFKAFLNMVIRTNVNLVISQVQFNLECERIEGSGHEYIKKYLDKSK